MLLDQLKRQIRQSSIVEIAIGFEDLPQRIEWDLRFTAHHLQLVINAFSPDRCVQLPIQVGYIADPILEIGVEVLALEILEDVGNHPVYI